MKWNAASVDVTLSVVCNWSPTIGKQLVRNMEVSNAKDAYAGQQSSATFPAKLAFTLFWWRMGTNH